MSKAATPEGTARRAAKMREAAAKSLAGRRPHKFVSRFEQLRRMNIIESLYLRGERNQEQVAARLAAGITFEDGTTLQLSRSRTLVYFARLRERWSAEAEAERRKLKGEWRKSVLVDLAGARANKDYGPAMRAHKLLAEVDGLVGPVRHEVSVQLSGVDAGVFRGWTDEQLAAFVDRSERPGDSASVPNGTNDGGSPR